jgi:2-polyprenyl-6-methoxyphenol hydroxylase-like FAD-dependent oxidoreductase
VARKIETGDQDRKLRFENSHMAPTIHSDETEVLIAGAGPTGLVLALWLTRLGVRVRIVDKTSQPGTTSRALAVQARTLEFYGQLGFADEVVAQGRWATEGNLWVGGRRAAQINLDGMGSGISPYPYPLIFPQDEHERLLIERLAALGVTVERETEVLDSRETGDRVQVTLRKPDGSEETCNVAYVAGCDGARSTTREHLGIGFPGGTYEHLFYVADVQATGQAVNGDLNIALERSDFLVVFPLKSEGRARFIGTVKDDSQRAEELSWDSVNKGIVEHLRTDVQRVNWFSTYRVHHRVADRFRKGRSFLLGDAAHIHSPVGGQGMNTGIGDAVNLAWKLAAVLRGRATVSLLDTYEPERIAFARRLVATTDRAFTTVTSSGTLARFVRLRVVPVLAPLLFSSNMVRRLLFRTVSQVNVNYRGSSLSVGRVGSIHAGDRLPWMKTGAGGTSLGGANQDGGGPSGPGNDNFAPLKSLDWQLHLYGEAAPEVQALSLEQKLRLHVFPWRAEMKRSGLRRNALYLVRPDGYVAVAADRNCVETVRSYLAELGFSPA